MPPKPSFRVKLSSKQQENVPPTTTSFALPGTVADSQLQRKLQRESSFNSSHIQKTRLTTWDLNTSSTSALPNRISTISTCGMTTPQTPSSPAEILGHTTEADACMERKSGAAWEDTFPL